MGPFKRRAAVKAAAEADRVAARAARGVAHRQANVESTRLFKRAVQAERDGNPVLGAELREAAWTVWTHHLNSRKT